MAKRREVKCVAIGGMQSYFNKTHSCTVVIFVFVQMALLEKRELRELSNNLNSSFCSIFLTILNL